MSALEFFFNNFVPIVLGIYNSVSFSIIKFLLGIYAVVVFADIVLLLIQRGLSGDLRDTFLGMNVPAELVTKKGKLRKKWAKIREKLKSENESDYKVAIIEADNIIDDLVKRLGYAGDNMGERLYGINPNQIDNIEELKKAHEFRNRIIHEENFKLDKKQAEEIMECYEGFLRSFEVLN